MPGSATPPQTEWALLRTACSHLPTDEKTSRIRTLLNQQIHWQILFELADHHGVQPILTQALAGLDDRIPPQELVTLKKNYDANLHKALFLSREFLRIVDCLSQAGIEFMPYKGLALAEMIYGDIALRQSGDIDLLIHAADLKRTREAVRELGYMPHSNLSDSEEAAYLRSGYECVFDGPAGKNLLEVQWAILPRFYAVELDVEQIFRRAIQSTVAGVAVKTPSLEDTFLLLSLHAAKHVWERLIWICDLARISQFPGMNWNWIGNQSRELGIARIVRVALLLAKGLLESPIPKAAEENVPQDEFAGEMAKEIRDQISGRQNCDVESLKYFKLMMRLRERSTDRFRFMSRLALTPGPGEWRLIELPKSLSPLYRIIRMSRLLGRVVSGRI